MATLTIRKFPDDLYERLREEAAVHRRSINNEAIVAMERALRPRAPAMDPLPPIPQPEGRRRRGARDGSERGGAKEGASTGTANLKGVILAGGLGTRLDPMTRVTNKHLLPVYDRPMIHYPIRQMLSAGIERILVVTGGNHAGDFLRLLRNGSEFGLRHLDYTYQEGEGGIADALALAEEFADGDPICVLLGDNLFQHPIAPHVEAFRRQGSGARILLKEVEDPHRFGVAELEGDRVIGIEEKPEQPRTSLAVTGCYCYDPRVFDIVRTLKPSERGELEITDVNNRYIEVGEMSFGIVEGWWTDAGTVSSLFRAARLVEETGAP